MKCEVMGDASVATLTIRGGADLAEPGSSFSINAIAPLGPQSRANSNYNALQPAKMKYHLLTLYSVTFLFATNVEAADRYVDINADWRGNGTAASPYQNVIEGVLAVANGGDVYIRPGTYSEKLFINKSLQLRSNGGPVNIGSGASPGFITCDGGPMKHDDDGDGIDDECEEALAQKFAPIIFHSSDESNYPTSVDWFLQRTSLWFYDDACDFPSSDLHQLMAPGPLTQQNLFSQIGGTCGSDQPASSAGTRSNRKHRTFYLQDLPDAVRIGSLDTRDWITYYHAYPNDQHGVTIQYWRFYAYNDAANNHGGDWEGIHLILDASLQPTGIGFLGHTSIDFVPASQIQWEGTHPRIFSEGGGHASHPSTRFCETIPVTGIVVCDITIQARNCSGAVTALDLSDPCTFVRQETWNSGLVNCQNPAVTSLIGQNTVSGGLRNLGSKIAPLNGQVFIQYSGIWGSPGTLFEFSGYWDPAYNETGMVPKPDDNSPPEFITAWGNGVAPDYARVRREWY
jgi:hypothetical protein